MSFANLFKALPTAEDHHDTAAYESRRHPQRKGSKHVPSSQEKDHDRSSYNARQQRHGGKELKASNEKRRGHHDERQGHKTRKSFSHKDNHRGNYKQPSLGFTQQLQQYVHSRDTGLNKTNSRPEVDCRTKHNKYDNPQRPQQQQQRRGKWIHKEESHQHRPNNRGRPFTRSGQHQGYCTRRDFSGRGPDEGGKKDPPVEKKRHMTQEFMDQNGVEVVGHGLVCRHFLCGRCTKGDECQLPHVQNMSNNMLKEVCKFYVAGCCNKGENCPYMHSSFPCKYFHTRGCFTGAECRFSHEPLTDLTKTLLDGALKRDLDYAEMQMKAQLPVDEPDQSKNTEEPLAAENMAVDKPKLEIRLDSIRPNFYNSTCSSEAHAEKVALCHAGVSADTEKEDVPLHDTDPASVASSHPGDDEIVPYSVEAVLGSQIGKVFPSLPGAPAGKESTAPSLPSTSIRCPSNSANQSAVPYSVNAVLESYKSEATSKCSLSSGSISRALYIPLASKAVPSNREIPGPPGYSATCKEKVFSGSESNIPLERRFTGQTPAGQVPVKQFSTAKKWPNLPHTSVASKELVGNISMFQKPPGIKEESQVPVVQNSASKHFIKTIAHLTTDITGPQDPIQANNPAVCSDGLTIKGEPVVAPSKNKTAFHNLFLNLPSQSSAPPKCPVQLKSQRPCAPSDQGEPMQSRDTALIVARSKSALHVSATHITCQTQSISTYPVTQKCVLKLSEKIKCQSSDTLSLTDSTQPPGQAQVKFNDADCKITMAQDVKSMVDGIKPITKPFHSLFAIPLGEILPSVQTTPDSLTTLSCPQTSSQSSYPIPNSTDCKEKVLPMRPVVESGKATERPFLSLFVSPPCEPSAPPPPEQTKPLKPIDCTSSSRGCEQKASHLGVKRLFTDLTTDSDADTPAAPRSSQSPPTTKSKKAKCISSTEYNQNTNETLKQSESQACRLSSETPDEKSTIPVYTTESSCPRTQTAPHPPKALSHKVTPMAATKNSVMSTLFLHLSPYHEDKEPQSNIQNSLSLECENEDRSCLIGQQQDREVEEKKVDELMEKTMQDEPVRIPVESSPCLSMSEPHQQFQSSVPRALSAEKTIPTKHRPAFPPFALQRAAAGSASGTAGLTENQVRTTATHSLPIQPVTQPHTHLAMKRSCQQLKSVNGTGDDTPFSTIKNLFKTLDPTASPFGQ